MASTEVVVPFGSRSSPRDTLGRPLRDLRISVMDRCNFRCPYCMPRETFHDKYRFLGSRDRLSFEEIVRLTRLFAQLGVRKLRLTGGEPLLRANLADLIGDLTELPGIEDIALTTNGVLLAKYAAELKAAGLKRITVSLDSLDPKGLRNNERWLRWRRGRPRWHRPCPARGPRADQNKRRHPTGVLTTTPRWTWWNDSAAPE